MVGDFPPSKYATSSAEDGSKLRRDNRFGSRSSNNRQDGDQRDQRDNYSKRFSSTRGGGTKKPFNPWRLPERWNEYTNVGQVIPKTRIISFKTPLKAQYFGEETIPFGVDELLKQIKALDGELGLIVDLTYTTKYYDPESFTDNGIEYKKIFCPGRDFNELEKLGGEFVTTLKEFFECNKHNNKWVGVHCTHGLNRTGYLVCRYLHEALGWPMKEAIKQFETARGHTIDREEYVEALKKFSITE